MNTLENFPSYIKQNWGSFLAYCLNEPNRKILEVKKTKPLKPKICRKCGEVISKGIYGCITLKLATKGGGLFNKYFHEECYTPIIEKLAEYIENLDSRVLDFEDLTSGYISTERYEELLNDLREGKLDE